VRPLKDVFESIVTELRNTTIHPSLSIYSKSRNLLEALDENVVRKNFNCLKEEYDSLSMNMVSIKDDVLRIKEEMNTVVGTKLDESPISLMKQARNQASDQHSTVKKYMETFDNLEKQANNQLKTIRAEKSKDVDIKQAMNSKIYSDITQLFSLICKEDENSKRNTLICKEAKSNATKAMLGNIHSMGQVLLNIGHTFSSISSIQKGLNQLDSLVSEFKKISKLMYVYRDCLKETQRRKMYGNQTEALVSRLNTYLKSLRDNEITKRLAFQKNFQNEILEQLTPFLVKTEEEERKLPFIQLSLSPFDEDIPEIDEIESSLEDEFSLVIADSELNPTERMKALEEENARLIERINGLLTKQTIDSSRQILIKNQRISQLESEVEAMRGYINSNETSTKTRVDNDKKLTDVTIELHQYQRDNNMLQYRNQILQRQYQEMIEKNSLYEKRITELQHQLEKSKQSNDQFANEQSILKITEMGFSRDSAIKALMLNNNQLELATAWLLENAKEPDLNKPFTNK